MVLGAVPIIPVPLDAGTCEQRRSQLLGTLSTINGSFSGVPNEPDGTSGAEKSFSGRSKNLLQVSERS